MRSLFTATWPQLCAVAVVPDRPFCRGDTASVPVFVYSRIVGRPSRPFCHRCDPEDCRQGWCYSSTATAQHTVPVFGATAPAGGCSTVGSTCLQHRATGSRLSVEKVNGAPASLHRHASGSDSGSPPDTPSTSGGTVSNPSTSNPSSSSTAQPGGLTRMLQQWNQNTKKLRQQLQSLGLAGVVAYGLFNTAYYTVAFLFVWFTVANVPAGLGLQAAARKAVEVFALVWAGSQVTKLLRAGGALALAPVVDQGLTLAVEKFRLQSKQQAFGLVVAACVTLAAAVFGFVVAVHA